MERFLNGWWIGMVEVAKTNYAALSKRQRECLQGVADHLDSQQIAVRLGISPHTVDGHIAASIKALGARSRRDAVRLAGLISYPGQSPTGQFPSVDFIDEDALNLRSPQRVEEATHPFVAQPPCHGELIDARSNKPYLTLLWVLGGAAAIVIILLALDPLARSAASLANAIQPLHHR